MTEVPALTVERAVRLAARLGNGLLAGSTVELVGESWPRQIRHLLQHRLRALGARLLAPDGVMPITGDARTPDFVFVAAGATETPALRARGDGRNATIVIPVGGSWVTPADALRGSAADRIAWAARGMSATRALAEQLRHDGLVTGTRIAVSLVLEPKTAALALALRDAGAEVAVFSAVSETDPEVARALALEPGITVCAPTEQVARERAEMLDARHAREVLEWGPELLIDDGAHLIRLAHTEVRQALGVLRAASEETTSGVRPLREMVAQGELEIPVIAVNDARTKADFDNRIGTGESCVFAIADLLDSPAATEAGLAPGLDGAVWCVVGYGPVGAGVAECARALGAEIAVVDHDPVRALAALHDGYEVVSLDQGTAAADVVVSATGVWHTLNAEDLARLRPGTVVAVAGGVDDELALTALREAGWRERELGTHLAVWSPVSSPVTDGFFVLAHGHGVNYTAAEGNPVEIMDLSFATQLAAVARLARSESSPGVTVLETADEELVARLALESRGGKAPLRPETVARPGGAAQPWQEHRYLRDPETKPRP